MESKYINRYHTFCRSLKNLKKSLDADPKADFVLEGTVMNFNLTFDISWKVMKDILIKELAILDFAVGSPRETLRQAFLNGIIDSDKWMQMLRVRNQLAHDYDGEIVKAHCQTIVKTYLNKFEEFQTRAEKLLWERE